MNNLVRFLFALAIAAPLGCRRPAPCDTGACMPSTDEPNDTYGSADADTDTDADVDTAVRFWYAGDASVTDNVTFEGGHFGYMVTDTALNPVCADLSEWSATGESAPPCGGCDWAFTLALSDGRADGDCDRYDVMGGEWDGFTAWWGFAEAYPYAYGGQTVEFELVVLYYFKSDYSEYAGWYPLSYNYAGYGNNSGDASHVTFWKSLPELYTYAY